MSEIDPRPANCRFRLQDEGKPYPKSGCASCGATVATGLGKTCRAALSSAAVAEREPVVAAWQFKHYDPISGHPVWKTTLYWNGHRATEYRPLYTSPPTSEVEAENERLKAELDCALIREGNEKHHAKIAHQNMNAEINARERTEARLAEAMKALAPFARLPDFVDRNNWDDDAVVYFKNGRSVLNTVSLGDLRAARRVREGGKVDG